MSENDRFYACESLGFPEVTQYDYETNLSTRGVNDLDFRWEDVAVQSIYLMQEATISGSFEYNTVVTDLGITNPTGVNTVTTGDFNTSSYTGWTLSGNATVYIGQSGIRVESGDLPGIESSFQAHPIDSDEAVGLFCASGFDFPYLQSVDLGTGEAGPMINGNTHQVFLRSKLNYGETGELRAIMRGWSAGSVVAYYDTDAGSWVGSMPSATFPLNGNGYTTVKYEFETDSFPAVTPSSYDLLISNEVSGTFVTVDDVHIDVLMRKNAFLDYIVPTGYMIQVTPDLGWHNVLDMFENNSDYPNPHLKTLGPYQVDLANLTDNLDNSVTATVDSQDFQLATSNNFKKYLWRALPISPNGDLGAGGIPARFEYIGAVLDSQFSVDGVQEDDTTTKVVTGTKSSSMSITVDGRENFPGLTYPTSTTWKLVYNLNSASRTLAIRAKDVTGAVSSVRYVKLESNVFSQNSTALWNAFDEHGLVSDVERIPGESNYDYSKRIKDSFKFRSSPDFVGIVNGASRELNLTKVTDSIRLSILRNEFGQYKASSFEVEVTPHSIRIHNPMFTVTERLRVDPVHKTIDFTYLPKESPVQITSDSGKDIGIGDVKVKLYRDSSRISYRAVIDCEKANFVDVTYYYWEEALFKSHPTIESVIWFIRGIKDPSGQQIIDANISTLLSGNEPSVGLYVGVDVLEPESVTEISWSPVVVKRMTDVGYRDYFISKDETLKQTEYFDFIKELKNNTKIFWGSVEADRDRWDAADSKSLSMESIPTLFDPPITKILSEYTGEVTEIEPISAWGRSFVGYDGEYTPNRGLVSELFQPGVAHTDDLKPDVYVTSSYINTTSTFSGNVSPSMNSNTVVLFSGQK